MAASPDRQHHADEFGQSPSAPVGCGAPTIGSPAVITLAGIVEQESGRTPGPPVISMRAVVIALVLMLILGAAGLIWFDGHGGHGRGSAQQFLDTYEQSGQ